MNKLGFAVKVASQGAGNAIECNSGQWLKKVVDIRDYLKMFSGLSGTDNIVTFISFDSTGCYLTLLRSISGRVGDFLSGWIYIPNTIEIDEANIIAAYNFAKRVLGESSLKSISGEIESFFATEYQEKEYCVPYNPSTGEKYGVRYLGHYSLKELLGRNRYQIYYSKYKAIFLMNRDDEVKITKEAAPFFEDLTKFEMENYCILKLPSKDVLYFLGNGVKIYLENEKEMLSNVSCKQGDVLNVFAKREGFEPLKLQITVNKEVVDFPIVKNPVWKKRISHSMFKVVDKDTHNPIKITKLIVNKTEVTFNDCLFEENDCREAKVTLKANGYAELSTKVDLLRKEILTFEMTRETQSRSYVILMTNGQKAEMSLESKYIPSSTEYGSPIRSYKFDELDKNLLRPSSMYVWKQRFLGFLSCIAALLLFGLYQYLSSSEDSSENPDMNISDQTTPNTDNDGIHTDSTNKDDQKEIDYSEAVISYLKTTEQLKKDTLETYDLTKGLYDQVNNYDFESLSKLKMDSIKTIAQITSLSKEMVDQGFRITNEHYSTDGSISINRWLDTVRKKFSKWQEEKKVSQQGGNSMGFIHNIGVKSEKKTQSTRNKDDKKDKEKKDNKDNGRGGNI